MVRNLMCGMAAGLLLIGAAARADDGGTAGKSGGDIAADVAKLKDDTAAVKADKAKVKAAHEQVVDDRQQLAKDRAAHDKTAVARSSAAKIDTNCAATAGSAARSGVKRNTASTELGRSGQRALLTARAVHVLGG